MKTDNLEKILCSIDKKALGSVIDEREKRFKKLDTVMNGIKDTESKSEEFVTEKESRSRKILSGILKGLSVAAAVTVIAGIIYVVRIPLFMSGKGPDPVGTDTAKVPFSDTAAEDTRQEAVVQEYEFTDVSQIRPGMTCEEVENTLPEQTYSTGLLSKRGIKYYVNDKETGRVFFVYCEDGVVTDVRDSGKAVGYAAPGSYLSKLHDGMSFDDVVSILGSPVYSPLNETLLNEMMIRHFRVEDRANISLSFTEKPDGADGASEIVLENLERDLYRYGKDELLLGYYDVYRTDMVSEKAAAGIIAGMTFGRVYSMIGGPISRVDYGSDTVTPCWRLGPNKWLAVRFVPVTYTVTDPASELIADRVEIKEMDNSYAYPDPKDRNFKAADRIDKNDLKTWFDPDNSAVFDVNNLNKIKKGMTFEEIVGILGRPVRGGCPTPKIKCNMQWEYDGGYTTVVIGFKQTDSFFPAFDMVIDYYVLIDSNNEDPESRMVTKHF